MVDVDVFEIVELLQHEVRGIVEQVGAPMPPHPLKEHLVARAIMEILTWMNLIADVDSVLVGFVEQRRPALRQLVKGGLDQPGGALRPGIDVRPRQGA